MTLAPGADAPPAHPRRLITALMGEAMVEAIANEAWTALVGEDELLVPIPGDLPADTVSAWVDVVGDGLHGGLVEHAGDRFLGQRGQHVGAAAQG